MKTTNYYHIFIEVSEDCPITVAEAPPQKAGEQTTAGIAVESPLMPLSRTNTKNCPAIRI